MFKTHQKGATLLELTMAIGIIAVIAIAAISFFNNASDSQKSLEATRNVAALTAGIRNQFQSQGDYLNIDNATVKLGNAFPRSMDGGPADEIKHPWSAAGITVASNTIVFAEDSFTITMDEVPQGACVDIGSKLLSDYEEVDIGGLITEVSEVAAGCADPDANILIFTAR